MGLIGSIAGLIAGKGGGDVATNSAFGVNALAANTTGANNVAVGYQALDANTTGAGNTAVGQDALGANTTGGSNTALGRTSLLSNTTGSDNTALGKDALRLNTTGARNTAVGETSLYSNETGVNNTAVGKEALFANTTGGGNTAVGYQTLTSNTTGRDNTTVGYQAGYSVTIGYENCIIGYGAGDSITQGFRNVAIGGSDGTKTCLGDNVTGNYNVAIGSGALGASTAGLSTAIGYQAGGAATSTQQSVCIGYQAGYGLVAADELWIANNNVARGNPDTWIYGSSAGACTQGNNSSSWSTVSDGRLKNVIGNFDKGLDAIKQLNVIKFKYKTVDEMPDFIRNEQGKLTFEPDPTIEHTGIIAQDLQAVIPEAVTEDRMGALTVDSDPVFWAGIKAIKELAAEVDALKAEIAALKGA